MKSMCQLFDNLELRSVHLFHLEKCDQNIEVYDPKMMRHLYLGMILALWNNINLENNDINGTPKCKVIGKNAE